MESFRPCGVNVGPVVLREQARTREKQVAKAWAAPRASGWLTTRGGRLFFLPVRLRTFGGCGCSCGVAAGCHGGSTMHLHTHPPTHTTARLMQAPVRHCCTPIVQSQAPHLSPFRPQHPPRLSQPCRGPERRKRSTSPVFPIFAFSFFFFNFCFFLPRLLHAVEEVLVPLALVIPLAPTTYEWPAEPRPACLPARVFRPR